MESTEEKDLDTFARPSPTKRVYQECLQRLYLLVFKMHCIKDFKEATSFCKSMLAYKHITPWTTLERILTDPNDA